MNQCSYKRVAESRRERYLFRCCLLTCCVPAQERHWLKRSAFLMLFIQSQRTIRNTSFLLKTYKCDGTFLYQCHILYTVTIVIQV